jgi:flagellar biosynthesis protein FlhF
MKIKSYFSNTVEGAMAMARQELGLEAMLINTRKAPVESGHPGQYEVVFGVAERPPAPAPAPAPETAPPARDRIAEDVADLKKELEAMRRAVTRSAFAPPEWLAAAPDLSEAYSVLTANEVGPELARDIVHGAQARAAKASRSQTVTPQLYQRALVDEIESRFTVEAGLGRPGVKPRITALVGPPGAGKTTTLIKLAVNYGLAGRKPVMLLSMDNYRIAAAEQLRAYAGILGVGIEVLDTVAALGQAIEENSGKDLILIDTPGLSHADIGGESGDAALLARFLRARPDIDTQLTIPASMKPADAARLVDAYAIFQPQRLIFTRMDETSSHGSILNEAARTGKPVSFFTKGQRIPEDLEEATASRITGLVLNGHTLGGQNAQKRAAA